MTTIPDISKTPLIASTDVAVRVGKFPKGILRITKRKRKKPEPNMPPEDSVTLSEKGRELSREAFSPAKAIISNNTVSSYHK